MTDVVATIGLIANAFALGVAGVLYAAYIHSLRSQLDQKQEKVEVVEKNLQFWKDRAGELEKKTPDFIVRSLSDRIKISEEEIKRLHEDKKTHASQIEKKNAELKEMRLELERAKESRKSLEDVAFDDGDMYEMEEIGSVAVDSGQLMVTDPCYIDSEWIKEDFEDMRLYKDVSTKKFFQYGKDFQNFQEVLSEYGKTVNELVAEGVLVKINVGGEFNYSYNGASKAVLSENGYGNLKFKLGHEGAGFAFNTLYGDGDYPIYGEKIDGKLVRVMIDLS